MSASVVELAAIHDAAIDWSRKTALPLWSSSGFDAATGQFQEQLGFDRQPVLGIPRRAMVQARQIVVYSSAAIDGWFPTGAELAKLACDRLIERFHAADGKPGYVFSLSPDGHVTDDRRDLYAHAFVLFAMAWRLRLDRAPHVEAAAEQLLAYIHSAFAAPDGEGFVCTLPRPDRIRRQNPHMHLFEAALELAEVTGSKEAFRTAAEIRDLAMRRFIRIENGALLEYFDDDWQIGEAFGAPPRAEPGHQMEWAWLLRRHQKVAAVPDNGVVGALIGFAERFGIDARSGRVIDEVDANGQPTKRTSRSWPHTETVKALALEAHLASDIQVPTMLVECYHRLMTKYCSPVLGGGWIDQLDGDDHPVSKVMPASTLYHVHLAIREVDRLLAGRDG
jgi:mannose/cellobiose epimerase-like protein (N-acyl-D-glucosamine 2-epimerase family)